MDKENNKFVKIITDFFRKTAKTLLFIIIFSISCFLYNQNSEPLNKLLHRVLMVEYSISPDTDINKQEISEKLSQLNFKYGNVEVSDVKRNDAYDYENEKVEKVLIIKVPYILKESNKNKINELSEYIFDKYNAIKLIDVKITKENRYSKPYRAFLIFLALFIWSLFVEYTILYILTGGKKLNSNIKENFKNFFINKKESIKNLIKNTKEKGVSYLIKKILFDENKDEEETNYTKEIVSTIVFVLLCVIFIRYFIGELRWIPSGSMRPTIMEHDRVFVEKLDYPKKEIKRGDILVFYPPGVELSNSPLAILSRLSGIMCYDIAYIKRVVGLPGEKFEIKLNPKSGQYAVYINDKPKLEPYISSRKKWTPCNEQMYCGPFIIPEGKYFMMGDNRDNSQDSRFWGFLDKERIIGRANFLFFPIRRINLLNDNYFELSKQKIDNKIIKEIFIINRY